MNSKVIGRKTEYRKLEKCMNEVQAQLLIVYGRRRVGKTFLINHFFDGRFDFKLTGAYNQPLSTQLRNFNAELSRQSGTKKGIPKDWIEAFEQLRDYIENLSGGCKRVIFIDEMPWLDTAKSGFLPAFEWFWNDWASAQDNLLMIVCGSATSWMVDKIAENKGGLFNRQSCKLYLEPFTLKETEEYLQSKGINWSRYDIAECYMIMGGIPYYLSLLDSELSYSGNIDNMFFRKRAELWDEFDHLYSTLFSESAQYIKVVEALAGKSYGLTRLEIAGKTGLPENGTLTKILKNLVDSGFARAYTFYGKKKKGMIYQLADYYTMFYLKFLKGNPGHDENCWSNTLDSPSRRAWAGFTFEQLCKDHIRQIKQKIGISGVYAEVSSWYAKGSGNGNNGAQIDMLIDRRDRVINICEIKFSINDFEIDKAYDMALRNKIAVFREATGCRKSIQPTLITTFGVKKNMYSSIAEKQVVLDDLFCD